MILLELSLNWLRKISINANRGIRKMAAIVAIITSSFVQIAAI